jgi:hypothetical protein
LKEDKGKTDLSLTPSSKVKEEIKDSE